MLKQHDLRIKKKGDTFLFDFFFHFPTEQNTPTIFKPKENLYVSLRGSGVRASASIYCSRK